MPDTYVKNNVEQSDPNVIANNEFFINIGHLLAENIEVISAETNSKYFLL